MRLGRCCVELQHGTVLGLCASFIHHLHISHNARSTLILIRQTDVDRLMIRTQSRVRVRVEFNTETSKSLSFQIKSQLQGFQVTEQVTNGEQGSNIIRTQKSK